MMTSILEVLVEKFLVEEHLLRQVFYCHFARRCWTYSILIWYIFYLSQTLQLLVPVQRTLFLHSSLSLACTGRWIELIWCTLYHQFTCKFGHWKMISKSSITGTINDHHFALLAGFCILSSLLYKSGTKILPTKNHNVNKKKLNIKNFYFIWLL